MYAQQQPNMQGVRPGPPSAGYQNQQPQHQYQHHQQHHQHHQQQQQHHQHHQQHQQHHQHHQQQQQQVQPAYSPPTTQEHTDVLHDTQFDYYGHLLATASSDRTVGIYAVRAQQQQQPVLERLATLVGHEGPVWMVSWAHPRFGRVLASASYDHSAIVWSEAAQGGSQCWKAVHVIGAHQGSVNAVQWAPEEFGCLLATASSDGTVAVTAYAGGAWGESVCLSNNSNRIAHAMGATAVSFAPYQPATPHSMLLASGGCDSHVRLWYANVEGGIPQSFSLLQVLNGHTDWVRDVAFHPMSSATEYALLASCGQDRRVIIYRKKWSELAREEAERDADAGGGRPATSWEQVAMTFEEPVWRLSWSPLAETLTVTTGSSSVFVLRPGVSFSDEWVRTPLSEKEA